MADSDDLRARLAEAERRADKAEAELQAIRDFPGRMARFGLPVEAGDAVMMAHMSDAELERWVGVLREHIEKTNAEAVAAARPDRRRGQMLVQNAPGHIANQRPDINGR
jgi:hypothetical protein